MYIKLTIQWWEGLRLKKVEEVGAGVQFVSLITGMSFPGACCLREILQKFVNVVHNYCHSWRRLM